MAPFKLPRRRFLGGLLAAGALRSVSSLAQAAAAQPAGSGWVLLGTQTGAGIYRARWDSGTGQLGRPELAAATPRPTFLTAHPTLPVIYAGNELDVPQASVSAFSLDRQLATLTALSQQPTHGSSPCFVSTDKTGEILFAANYGGGSLASFMLDAQGAPASGGTVFACDHTGVCGTAGPVTSRQDGPHLHCATVSPGNHFVLACDLGDDSILAFPLHPGQTPAVGPPQRLPARLGSGPRHLAFHPNGRWLYCIHELDCTVDRYSWSSTPGVANATLAADSVMHLAPAGPGVNLPTPNTAAEIAISRDGSFLYTCTRGVNILSSFRINPSNGALTPLQQLSCGGQSPRFFALDPTERWLVVTNQDSSNVAVFSRNPGTGLVAPHGGVAMPSPMCVLWL